MSRLEVVDNLVEVPGEGQHVGVLLLREFGVNAESRVFVRVFQLVVALILL